MFNTTSSEYTMLERRMRDAVALAEESSAPLVIGIHPRVEEFIRLQAGLHTLDAPELRSIAGVRNIIISENVPGFRVIICNEHI